MCQKPKSKIIENKFVDVEAKEPSEKKLSFSVEEALNATGFGKYNYGLLLVCSWTLQAMGLDMFGISFVAAAAVCDLELSMQERAMLTAMPLVGVVLGAQLWGYVSDTRGRRITLTLSMSLGFLFAALSSFAPDWITMAVLKLLSSTFTSASNSSVYTLLGECCPSRSRGRAMLLCTCMLMCSQATAAVLAYPILPLEFSYPIPFLDITFRPWRLLALVLSLPCAITAILFQFFHESPKFLASRGRYDEALDVLKSIYSSNSGDTKDNFIVKKLTKDEEDETSSTQGCLMVALWKQMKPLFQRPLLKETIRLFYLVAVVYMTGSGFIMWLPYIMNNLFSVLETGAGQGMNLCTIITYVPESNITANATIETCNDTVQQTTLLSAITYGAVASLSNLCLSLTCGSRKRLAMLCILLISAVSATALNLVKIPIAGGILFFMLLLSGLSMGFLSVYFVELYPTSVRGTVSCLSIMVGRFSAFLGVNAIGALLVTSCEGTFYGWSIILFSAVAVAWFLPKDKAQE